MSRRLGAAALPYCVRRCCRLVNKLGIASRSRPRINSAQATANIPGNCTKDNFPLEFSEVEVVVRPAEENLDFLRRFLPKLHWRALVDTARALGDETLPDEMPAEWSDEQLRALHHVILEVSIALGWGWEVWLEREA